MRKCDVYLAWLSQDHTVRQVGPREEASRRHRTPMTFEWRLACLTSGSASQQQEPTSQLAFPGLQREAEAFEKTLVLLRLDKSAWANKGNSWTTNHSWLLLQGKLVYNPFHKRIEIHFIIPLGFLPPQYACRKVVKKSQSLEDQKPISLLRSTTSS